MDFRAEKFSLELYLKYFQLSYFKEKELFTKQPFFYVEKNMLYSLWNVFYKFFLSSLYYVSK